MRSIDNGLRCLLIMAVCAAGLASCSKNDPSDDSSRNILDLEQRARSQEIWIAEDPPSGTLVWLHDQEPVSINGLHPDNVASRVAGWAQQGLLEGLFGVDSSIGYYPELLAETPTPEKQAGGKVVIRYRLRSGLKWSDGETLDTDDVHYTYTAIIDGCDKEADGSINDLITDKCSLPLTSRRGYNLITNFEVTSPLEFTVTLAEVYPDWMNLFNIVFAQHAFGTESSEINHNLAFFSNDDRTMPSSGPVVFDRWEAGKFIDLKANGNYHGSTSPDATDRGVPRVERFRIRFLPNIGSVVENLKQGKGHFVLTDVSYGFLELTAADNVQARTIGGTIYEHMGMSLANKHLESVKVRSAVVHAINRKAIVDELYRPVFGDAIPPGGLGNSYIMPSQSGYIDHQASTAVGNLSTVNQLMGEAGYSKGADGIWQHPTKGKVSLRSVTTANDSFREKQQEIVNKQLSAAGFEITTKNLAGSEFYRISQSATGPFASKTTWDLALFAWAGGAWPGGVSAAYGGKSSSNNINNIYGYSRTEFDKATKTCEAMMNQDEWNRCYGDVDKYATTVTGDTGSFVVPISQKPEYYAIRSDLIDSALVVPVDLGGPFINAADYKFN